MKRREPDHPDPEDMFADTRMTFGEHIEDLRTHLLRAIYGFLVAFLVAIPLGKPVLRFIAAPVEEQLEAFTERYNQSRFEEIEAGVKAGKFDDIPPLDMTLNVDIDSLAEALRERLGLPPADKDRDRPVLEKMQRGLFQHLKKLGVHHLVDWRKGNQAQFVQIQGEVADPLTWAMEV